VVRNEYEEDDEDDPMMSYLKYRKETQGSDEDEYTNPEDIPM
jgi:hypothetical protein